MLADPHARVWSVLIIVLVELQALMQHQSHFQIAMGSSAIASFLLTTFPVEVYSVTEYGDHEYAK